MNKAQDSSSSEGELLPSVFFVTDPLCSWCWGMAPEVDRIRAALAGEARVRLLLGGLGLQNQQPMHQQGWRRLAALWQQVAATTGQQFRQLSDDEPPIVFNSREACRAILAVASLDEEMAFDFLHALQAAFFLDGQDSQDLIVQKQIAQTLGLRAEVFMDALQRLTDARLDAALQASRGHGSNALPAVLVANRQDQKQLVVGGYVTAEFLLPDLRYWLNERGSQ